MANPQTPKKPDAPKYDEAHHHGFLMSEDVRNMDKQQFVHMILGAYGKAFDIKIADERIHNGPRISNGSGATFLDRYTINNLTHLKNSLVLKAGEHRAMYDGKLGEIFHGLDVLLEEAWDRFEIYVGTIEKIEGIMGKLADKQKEAKTKEAEMCVKEEDELEEREIKEKIVVKTNGEEKKCNGVVNGVVKDK